MNSKPAGFSIVVKFSNSRIRFYIAQLTAFPKTPVILESKIPF